MSKSTEFFKAIRDGEYETVRQLLEEASSEEETQSLLQVREYNDTGFMLAVRKGEYKIAGLLLDNGAKVDSVDGVENSATSISLKHAQQGNQDATRFLEKLIWRGNSDNPGEIEWLGNEQGFTRLLN